MKYLSLITVLSRKMLWRMIPLLLVVFLAGVLGVSTTILIYNQVLPASCFQTAPFQSILFIMPQFPNTDNEEIKLQANEQLRSSLLQIPHVEELYYRQGFWCTEQTFQFPCIVNAFSTKYLSSLRWPWKDTLPPDMRDPNTVGVWIDHAFRGMYHTGEIITLNFPNYNNIPITAQVIGFLPADGMMPDTPVFANPSAPNLNGLYQINNVSITGVYTLVANLEDITAQLSKFYDSSDTEGVALSLPLFLRPFQKGLRPIALQLDEYTETDTIDFIKKTIRTNAQGWAYSIEDILQSDTITYHAAYQRNNNNLLIFLYIILCGIGALQVSLIRRKQKEIAILRILGVPWHTLRFTWFMILLLPSLGACIAGCLLYESLSSLLEAAQILLGMPLLRFVSALILFIVTFFINLLTFFFWHRANEQEMRRIE